MPVSGSSRIARASVVTRSWSVPMSAPPTTSALIVIAQRSTSAFPASGA
jgi:hypothetical protein